MRLRVWIGLTAVVLIAAGSVAAALIVHAGDSRDFHKVQQDEASRAARQAQAVAGLSVGELSSAAAFFQAQHTFDNHEFDVVARSLLREGVLAGTAFIQRVPARDRDRFERIHRIEIAERGPSGHLRRAAARRVYFPLTYILAGPAAAAKGALGFDLGVDPDRGPYLRHARDTGKPAATPVIPLALGGMGIVVYKAVYRDRAPTATVAERRAALVGFAAGSFRVRDLAASAMSALPDATQAQLRVARRVVVGPTEALEDPAAAQIRIADQVWVLVVRDPNRPDVSLPLLLAVVGISLAALLGALILVWNRNERLQELQRQANQDSLTGLKNRRRFEEDLKAAMARSRREGTTGALLVLDLDNFKQVNDSRGHPAGDRVIREIAAVLQRRTRESDALARLGGDEFAVILPRCSQAEARLVAEAIADEIREHQIEDEVESITACIGVAMFGEDPRTSASTVVSEADTAMYAAKDAGRDCVRVFDPMALRDDAPEVN